MSDVLDRKECFNMAEGGKLVAKVPLSWKKTFSQGVVIPHKMRNCGDCEEDILCDNCDKLVNQMKEFSANLNEINREVANEFGHMLPKYVTTGNVLVSVNVFQKTLSINRNFEDLFNDI